MNLKTLRLCVLAVITALPFFAVAETLTINEAPVPIRVDGHLTDWPSARMILLDKTSQVVFGKDYWKSAEDFNGRVFLTYDDRYLYVGLIVEKNGGVVGAGDKRSLWNGDCLELFLSTDPDFKNRKRPSARDYHIGFSPGTECKNPQMFCFNKNNDVEGGRVVARPVKTGYLLEACVPLSFFNGLEIGPGKKTAFNLALDEGGSVSGKRLVQMDLSHQPSSWEAPFSWTEAQWVGKTVVSIPLGQRSSPGVGLVRDGTKGSTYMGSRLLKGKVVDGSGKPLAGAKVSTWPKTLETVTDAQGGFTLGKIKLYDTTVVYARLEGYASSLAAAKDSPLVVRLPLLPKGMDSSSSQGSPLFNGATLQLSSRGTFDATIAGTQESVRALGLNVIRLSGTESMEKASELQTLDKFTTYAREMGAEPMVEVPIRREDPGLGARWVRYCNVEKKYNVRFWTIGDEPDLDGRKDDPSLKGSNVYDYINDFRESYNAMKRMDPSIFVLGPEVAWKYTQDETDWITPFVQFNGDIVNMVSLHHYAADNAKGCSPRALQDGLRSVETVFQGVRDNISENSDVLIPLVVTGGNVCSQAVSAETTDDPGPDGFGAALWTAQKMGLLLKESLGMHGYSYLKGNGPLDLLSGPTPKPAYWALKFFGAHHAGNLIPSQVRFVELSVSATQNPQTKDVTLVLVNPGNRYYRPTISLNGKEGDLTVEAGLNQKFDFEIPSLGIACLKIKADRSKGEAWVYTSKMAREGRGPELTEVKPW